MERLLHFTWQKRLYPPGQLHTTDGRPIEIINPGVHNTDAGPDFFGAVVRLDGMEMAGNVELHTRSSDWYRHGHDRDPRYGNIVLHVVEEPDVEVKDINGTQLPQFVLHVPREVEDNYSELVREDKFPPCYRYIPTIDGGRIERMLRQLTEERMNGKVRRIADTLKRSGGDWERVCFITLARNFGFGINGDAFEEWAEHISLSDAGKHRDNLLQIESLFLGQAGLLDESALTEQCRRDPATLGAFNRYATEYAFLAHKFGLTPMPMERWRMLRTRPQNFPHIRLAQLAHLYVRGAVSLSSLVEKGSLREVRDRLRTGVSGYWRTHYCFGRPSPESDKCLQSSTLNLLVLNSVVPLLVAIGRYRGDTALERQGWALYDQIPPENNFITRSWKEVGVAVHSAAGSQALIHLKKNYCDRRDCLRCAFGADFLSRPVYHNANNEEA